MSSPLHGDRELRCTLGNSRWRPKPRPHPPHGACHPLGPAKVRLGGPGRKDTVQTECPPLGEFCQACLPARSHHGSGGWCHPPSPCRAVWPAEESLPGRVRLGVPSRGCCHPRPRCLAAPAADTPWPETRRCISPDPREAAKLGSRSPRGTRLPGRGTGSRGGADEGLRLGEAEMGQTHPWGPRESRTFCPWTTFLPREDVGCGSHAIMSRWSHEATLPVPEDALGPLFGLGEDRLKPNAPRRSPGGH